MYKNLIDILAVLLFTLGMLYGAVTEDIYTLNFSGFMLISFIVVGGT